MDAVGPEERPILVRMAQTSVINDHPTLETVVGDTSMGPFCAHSWCTGACGLPALTSHDGHLKVYGSMVAVGAVLQHWRVKWEGETRALTPEQTEYLRTRTWW